MCICVGTVDHSVDLVKPVDFSPEMFFFLIKKHFLGGYLKVGKIEY